MTNVIITDIENLAKKIESVVEGEVKTVVTAAESLEAKLAPAFKSLIAQIVATIGDQGVTILEQGLSDIGTIIASGGNVGAAIAALVPQVTAQVATDLKQDATNAAHGAVSLIIAALPTAATTSPVNPAA